MPYALNTNPVDDSGDAKLGDGVLELKRAVDCESQIVSTTLESLREQTQAKLEREAIESDRAQALTSALVAARRDEDKAMLASDEAVSHALRDKSKGDLVVLRQLLDKPYFARMVLKEEIWQPGTSEPTYKELEYKLGVHANTDCRIIDWRKAPISRLYYEYREGEQYSDIIQGRERNGEVILQIGVDISKGVLRRLSCSHGVAIRKVSKDDAGALVENWRYAVKGAGGSRNVETGELGKILPFISSDQFKLITEAANTAVMIQGVAGSGKSAVALHRLAWLLHEENSDLKPEQAVILAVTKPLKRYLLKALQDLELPPITVLTYEEWVALYVNRFLPHFLRDESGPARDNSNFNGEVRRPHQPLPSSIARVKRSAAFLRSVEVEANLRLKQDKPLGEIGAEILSVIQRAAGNTKLIIAADDSKLLNSDLLKEVATRTEQNFSQNQLDWVDDALIARAAQILHGAALALSASRGADAEAVDAGELQVQPGLYRHIVIDEVQELSPVDLAVVVSNVESLSGLTLVGDINQATAHQSFPGWEALQRNWKKNESEQDGQQCADGREPGVQKSETSSALSRLVALTVSHRSTAEIMAVAAVIAGGNERQAQIQSGERRGRPPIAFLTKNESLALGSAIKWLSTALQRYPDSLTAILCASMTEARQLCSFLQPQLGAAVRVGDGNSFSFEQGLVVTDIHNVKGLEFTNVLIWNPSEKEFPGNQQEARNLLYVAATRAEENLCFIAYKPVSTALPTRRSALIRWYEVSE